MGQQGDYCFGNVFITPSYIGGNLDDDAPYFVISVDPLETLPEIGKYVLCAVRPGRALRSWHIQCDEEYYIDCARWIRLTEKQLSAFKPAGVVDDGITDQLARYDIPYIS